MALPKEIKRTIDSIYIISDEDCNVEIYRRDNNEYKLVIIYSYTTAEIPYLLHMIDQDGLYYIKLTGIDPVVEAYLPMYPTLISNTANDFKSFVCDDCGDYIGDCGCSGITDLAKETIKYNTLTAKVLYLETYVINGIFDNAILLDYRQFIIAALESVNCKAVNLINDILKVECLTGAYTSNELHKLELIIRFLAIYYTELHSTLDLEVLEEEEIPRMYSLYLYDDWKDCLCNTCLRVEELEDIYESGLDPAPDPVTNFPPTADHILRLIEASNGFYNYDLLKTDFSDVYNDDTTSFPATIVIEAITSVFVFEDDNDVAVTVGQVIPFSDIENYKVNRSTADSQENDNFTFRVSDGELLSPIYKFNFFLKELSNYSPNVIEDFELQLTNDIPTSIRKNYLFNLGSVIDPEGDEITLAKVVLIQQGDVELWNGSTFLPVAENDVITLANYTDNGEFLRILYNEAIPVATAPIRTTDNPLIRLAFLDVGSNTYSNEDAPGNVMSIDFNISNVLHLMFTGGWLTEAQSKKTWIPIARVEYDGDIRDLTSVLVSQSGYTSAEVPLLIQVASSDLPYDLYEDPSSIVTPSTTNPPLNSYDILAYIDVLATRTIVHKVQINAVDSLNITSSITLQSSLPDANPKLYNLNFLEFDETDIADFDYLETAFPPDFLGTVPRSVLPLVTVDAIAGQTYIIVGAGLIGFSIETAALTEVKIFDNLNNDITNTVFKTFFDVNKELELHISQNVYAPSNLYIRLQF